VRILTRDPTAAADLRSRFVEVVPGDVRSPEALRRSLRGATQVISAVHGFAGPRGYSPRSVDLEGNRNLIEAAVDAGAERFVLISISGARADHPLELARCKYGAELALKSTSLAWTIIRPTAFAELWLELMSSPAASGKSPVVFGRGRNPVNFVSVADVAELVVKVVQEEQSAGETIEIGGPSNPTMNELAAMVQRSYPGSKPIRHIPRPALRAMSWLARPVSPSLARQARSALVMDEADMVFRPVAGSVIGKAAPESLLSGASRHASAALA
jgi:NADH dehydrogenase